MKLPKQSEDFPGWYQAVVRDAGMAESSMVRGTMVIKPWGYAVWERIQAGVDRRIKATGHENLYFPLFIPMHLLEREAEHVEGFAPEVAVVTHGGGQKLEEPLAVRPTSETIIWATYAKWIQSYRDLPLLYNQWANVVRWEMRPRLFLRTTEFLWQEGHTAHETAEEAIREALMILDDVYRATMVEDLAMPVLTGRKSASQRFPGAVETYCLEGLMRDGRSLQAGTSHYLGQNFAKAYDVQFLSRQGTQEYAYATSWGVTTRLVGGVIMTHGDDKGLRLPPRLAPVQVVVVPIYRSDDERSAVLEAADRLAASLDGVRVKVDAREEHRPGYKFNEWELKGVPLRLEIGPREVQERTAALARRDTGTKLTVAWDALPGLVPGLLDEVQQGLLDQAATFRDEHTHRPDSYDELIALMKASEGGFAETGWCGDPACEERVKADSKATIRLLPVEPAAPGGPCIVCGRPATDLATWATAY
ncbi:MAG: proline--tRNA ligase [Actinomycetota bacterium]